MPTYNNYFDTTRALRPYTTSTPFNNGSIAPTDAIRGEIPASPEGFWPSEQNGKWVDVEDHRGKEGYVNGVWKKVEDIGALPEGWTDELPKPVLTLAEKQEQVRGQRDSLLSACDFTQMPDNPLSDAEKEAWRIYRQALRDITENPLFATEPENVVFPVAP